MAENSVSSLEEMFAKTRVFELPTVQDNAAGWGPTSGHEVDGVPFAPFNKADRLGRVSDWISNKYYQNNRNRNFGSGSTGMFAYSHELEESSFSLVDNTPRFKPRDGRRRYAKFSIHNRRRRGRGFKRWANRWDRRKKGGKGRRGNQYRKRWNNYQVEQKDPSVPIQDNWEQVAVIDFADLNKALTKLPAAMDIITCGKVEHYAKSMDRILPRTPVDLARFENREFITATTSEDPVLQRLKSKNKGTVYGTDTILAVLMAASRSVNPWDLIVNKKDGAITFDKRANSRIDFLSVNENWNEVQESDISSPNHPTNLSNEATLINHNFSQHVLDSKQPADAQDEPNPFLGSVPAGSEPASLGYRYRKIKLSGDLSVVARCEVNGYTKDKQGHKTYLTVKALNEFDYTLSGGIDWRTKLEHGSAAVLASEMKNNGCKLAKWTAKSLMAGTDEFRLGFVSRAASSDGSLRHEILMVKKFKIQKFAQQLQIRLHSLWGSLKLICETIMEQEDGQYMLLKDPNSTKLLLFSVPEGPILETKPVAL